MKSKPEIVVIGAGLIGRTHVERAVADAALSAIVDPAPAAQAMAEAHSVPWFADIGECLSTMQPAGAIVASPNGLHLEHAETCLTAGIPALVEKPLADSAQSARTIADLATSTGVPVLVGHHRRHSPVIEAAREVIASGRLGRIVTTHASFWLIKPPDYYEMTWRTKPGGGPTYINLIHDIDLLQHLCGPITAVQAREANAVRGLDVEDSSAVILEYANGALGTVTISDTVPAPWSWELTAGENPAYPETDQSCYMIGGTEGSMSLPDLRIWRHAGPQSWWSPMDVVDVSVRRHDPVAAQFRHFLDVIAGSTPPRVTAEDGLRNIEVLEAIKAAAISGGTVAIGEG